MWRHWLEFGDFEIIAILYGDYFEVHSKSTCIWLMLVSMRDFNHINSILFEEIVQYILSLRPRKILCKCDSHCVGNERTKRDSLYTKNRFLIQISHVIVRTKNRFLIHYFDVTQPQGRCYDLKIQPFGDVSIVLSTTNIIHRSSCL